MNSRKWLNNIGLILGVLMIANTLVIAVFVTVMVDMLIATGSMLALVGALCGFVGGIGSLYLGTAEIMNQIELRRKR